MPVGALGQATDLVLELPQTLRAGPAIAPLEVVAQEVEASSLGGIDDPRLVRVEPQSCRGGPLRHLGQCLLGLAMTATQDHKVVRVPHHLVAELRHSMVQRVQVDIGQQRADDAPHAVANLEFEAVFAYRRGERPPKALRPSR